MVLTDNVGKIIASFFRPVSGDSLNINIVNLSGNDELCRVYTTVASFILHSSTLQVQIGKGTTPATRADFTVDDPFTNTNPLGNLENTPQNSGVGIYTVGLSSILIQSMFSPTGGSGNISEVVLMGRWKDTTNANFDFALSRDNISPVVSFIMGDIINVDYTIQF